MININLLPWREELQEQRKKQTFTMLGLAAAAALFVVIIMHLIFGSWVDKQKARNQYLSNEIMQVNHEINALDNVEVNNKQLSAQIETIAVLQDSRFQLVQVLDDLTRILPDDLFLTRIEQRKDVIELRGYAGNNASINQLVRNIDSSQRLSNPELEEIKVSSSRAGWRSFRIVLTPVNRIITGEDKTL